MWKIQKLIMTASIAGALVVALAMPATSAAACSNSKSAATETANAASSAAGKAIKSAGRKALAKSKKYSFTFKPTVCTGTLAEHDSAKGKKGGTKAFGNGSGRVNNSSSYGFPVTIKVTITGGGVNLLKGNGKVTITTKTTLSGSGYGSVTKTASFTL